MTQKLDAADNERYGSKVLRAIARVSHGIVTELAIIASAYGHPGLFFASYEFVINEKRSDKDETEQKSELTTP